MVVDAMMLTEGRNREEVVRCSSGRRLSSVWSVKKFATADRPGMRGYLHAMGKMSGLISSIADAIEWDCPQVLRISPKNPPSTTDVDIGPDDRWAFFDLAINYRGRTDTEKVLIHGTSQSSLSSNMSEAIQGETFDIIHRGRRGGKGHWSGSDSSERAGLLNKRVVPPSVHLLRGGYSRVAVDHAQMERLWDAWANAMLTDMMLPIYPAIVLNEMHRPRLRQAVNLA